MNLKNRKRKELVKSVVSLALCGYLLAGVTLDYFTNTVKSTGNTIKTKLINMEVTGDINSEGKIFNNEKIKEGQKITKKITIKNTGELCFDYTLNIEGDIGDNTELAEDIEVKLYGSSNELLVNKNLSDLLSNDTFEYESSLSGKDHLIEQGYNNYQAYHNYTIELLLPTNDTTGYNADTHSGKTISDITLSVESNERIK